jgi:hypothetical protein
MRSFVNGTNPGINGWLALAWLGGFLIVGYVASLILFRRRINH